MAQRDKANFKATKNTRFPDNSSGNISAANSRDMYEDAADSFLTISDNFIDEDSFASDSASRAPSQQSTKAYIAAQLASSGLSGSYTPTLTGVTNSSSTTSNPATYMRIGNVVMVSGYAAVTPTSGSTLTKIGVSLPIASNLTGSLLHGSGGCLGSNVSSAFIDDVTNDRAEMWFMSPASVTSYPFSFVFSYLINP